MAQLVKSTCVIAVLFAFNTESDLYAQECKIPNSCATSCQVSQTTCGVQVGCPTQPGCCTTCGKANCDAPYIQQSGWEQETLPASHEYEFSAPDNVFDGDAHSCSGDGTLFRWSRDPHKTGGPDLNEPLVTDRPDFTEASSTVGKGVVQVEFGYTYTYDTANNVSERSHSLGEPLWRIGMFADWFELRIAVFPTDMRTRTAGVETNIDGAEDLYLGAKLGLTPQVDHLPEMALIPQMTVPTGSAGFTNDEMLPGLVWIYAWEINDFIATAGQTQFNRSIDETSNNSYTEWSQSWTIAYTLTEDLGAYTEWYGLFPHSADTAKPEHYFNGGFTLLLTDDVQWDIRGGVGLNSAADDYFLGSGLSIRFH